MNLRKQENTLYELCSKPLLLPPIPHLNRISIHRRTICRMNFEQYCKYLIFNFGSANFALSNCVTDINNTVTSFHCLLIAWHLIRFVISTGANSLRCVSFHPRAGYTHTHTHTHTATSVVRRPYDSCRIK
jgi:hypothetical protein